MPPDPVEVAIVRLEGKVDALAAKIDGRHDVLQARVVSLEQSRTRVVGTLTAIIVAFVSTGLVALAHVR